MWMCEAGNGAVAASHTAQSSESILGCISCFSLSGWRGGDVGGVGWVSELTTSSLRSGLSRTISIQYVAERAGGVFVVPTSPAISARALILRARGRQKSGIKICYSMEISLFVSVQVFRRPIRVNESGKLRGVENPSIWSAGLSVRFWCYDPCMLCFGLFLLCVGLFFSVWVWGEMVECVRRRWS